MLASIYYSFIHPFIQQLLLKYYYVLGTIPDDTPASVWVQSSPSTFLNFFWGGGGGWEGRRVQWGGKVVKEGIKVAISSSYTEAKELTR